MYSRSKTALLLIVMILTILLVRAPLPTQGVQFIIADWEPRDENGQGFYLMAVWQNSSGSFINIDNPDSGTVNWWPENTTICYLNYTANTALMFQARVLVNYTLLGFNSWDIDSGKDYIRVSMDMSVAGTSVFSLNMTYDDVGYGGVYEPSIWWVVYGNDIAEYILVAGQIYTVSFTLEVFYYGGA